MSVLFHLLISLFCSCRGRFHLPSKILTVLMEYDDMFHRGVINDCKKHKDKPEVCPCE